ncbi:MAG: hypothetical protein H6841_05450 [Planctomycetes bacterium]|nr:hypothetical protein [Planctomycetota bacterium]MCB9935059.1 hypothetical protein [Planctomycetota bacterium]
MAEQDQNRARIDAALNRARARWLTSAMVNAGGRWAVLPAGVVALLAIALALAGVHTLAWLLPLCLLGVAGAVVSLLLTRRAYAQPAASGAPDWTLLLDRALRLDDALPSWLESNGGFRTALEPRIVAGLDPTREKQAAPEKHWGALVVALLLALLPLVFWRPEPTETAEAPEQVASEPGAADEAPAGAGPSAAGTGGGEQQAESPGGGQDQGSGGGGEEGEVQQQPDGSKGEGGAGEPPEGTEPKPLENNMTPPREGGVGDNRTPPSEPPRPEETEIEPDLEHVKPDVGEGETRTEDRSRWVYNPRGKTLDESTPTPPDLKGAGERAVPRTKLTTRERKLLQDLYKRLYE